jgi:hypothetical protein
MRCKKFIVLINILLLFSFSCKETPPEPSNGSKGNGMLIVEDVGVTDAVLRLRVPGGFKSQTVTLKRDTTTIFHSSITTHTSLFDTLIIDEALLPKHNYRYALTVNNLLNTQERSYADITTMDTTSHEFTWQIDTLGDGNSSILRDVAIINDTSVIAVGEIYKKDSLGNWINPPYNLARWNGKEWSLKRVMYNYQGIDYYSQLYSIFAFNENDYWVGSNQPMHWTGNKWETFDLGSEIWSGWINKIWGSSSSNIYIVGNQGALAHFDGTSWQKLRSGTDLDIEDIYGSRNLKTGEEEVLAIAASPFISTEKKILKISGDNVGIVSDSGISQMITSVWFEYGKAYYTCGSGVYWSRELMGKIKWKEVSGYTHFYKHSIAGNGRNDIVAAGDHGEVLHFNGLFWKNYTMSIWLSAGTYNRVAIKGNLVVAAGHNNGSGVVAIGRRY